MAPGKTLIRIVGILLIIFSVFSLLVSIGIISGGGFLANILPMVDLVGGALMAYGIVMLVSALFQLVTGILSVKYSDDPERSNLLMTLGVIMVIICVISLITGGSVISFIVSMILPVLLIVGASQNRRVTA